MLALLGPNEVTPNRSSYGIAKENAARLLVKSGKGERSDSKHVWVAPLGLRRNVSGGEWGRYSDVAPSDMHAVEK